MSHAYWFPFREIRPSGRCLNHLVKFEVVNTSYRGSKMLNYREIKNSDVNKKVPCPDPVNYTCNILKGNITWYKVRLKIPHQLPVCLTDKFAVCHLLLHVIWGHKALIGFWVQRPDLAWVWPCVDWVGCIFTAGTWISLMCFTDARASIFKKRIFDMTYSTGSNGGCENLFNTRKQSHCAPFIKQPIGCWPSEQKEDRDNKYTSR